jgi:hypothetical protein
VTWDPVWESVYRTRAWGQYPGEDVIRFVKGNFSQAPAGRDMRVCGEGHLKGLGATRFTDPADVPELLQGWRIERIERSSVTENGGRDEIRHLPIYATKP